MNLQERYNTLRGTINNNVKIVAVSKYKPIENIERLFKECDQLIFGENKAQEMDTIRWEIILIVLIQNLC